MKCLACSSSKMSFYATAIDGEYFTTTSQYTYNQCLVCDTLSIEPVPKEILSTIYPQNYYSFSEQKPGFLLKVKIFLDGLLFKKILKRMPNKMIRALDVGGGEGWMLDVLIQTDSRVQFRQIVDIDERAMALASKKGHRYFCGKFEDFPAPHPFDLILMLNLIEHVENPKEILQKAFANLAPSGYVLIKTPNYKSLDAEIFKDRNWGGYHCPRHWVLFSMNSFENLAREIGFSIETKKYTQGSPFWTWSILHILHKKGWIKLSAKHPAYQHPLVPILTLLFAAFDFLRIPFFKTSQMVFVLKKQETK